MSRKTGFVTLHTDLTRWERAVPGSVGYATEVPVPGPIGYGE